MKTNGIDLSRQDSRRREGFTLVEMLLVLVILAVLAAVVVPRFAGRGKQAKVTAAEAEISALETALDTFEIDNGYFPKSGDLEALVTQPNNTPNWKGPYIRRDVPKDPWNNDYLYEYPGSHNVNGYDLSSFGPDGRPGGDDDIVNWKSSK